MTCSSSPKVSWLVSKVVWRCMIASSRSNWVWYSKAWHGLAEKGSALSNTNTNIQDPALCQHYYFDTKTDTQKEFILEDMLFTEICFGIWFAKQKCSVFSFCNKVLMNFSCCDLIYRDQAIFYRTCWPPFSHCQLHQAISDCLKLLQFSVLLAPTGALIVMMVYYYISAAATFSSLIAQC